MPSLTNLYYLSQLLDYFYAFLIAFLSYQLFSSDNETGLDSVKLGVYCAIQGGGAVGILHFREEINKLLFSPHLPTSKTVPLPSKTYPYIFQTYSLSMSSFFLMYKSEIIFWSDYEFSFKCWGEIFIPFYTLLLLRDLFFLYPLHSLMHTPKYYHLHKLHHEAKNDAQSLHAFQIDLIDLIIEVSRRWSHSVSYEFLTWRDFARRCFLCASQNVGAPFLLFGLQYLLNQRIGIHWLVGVLLTFHDGGLHSVNPYSVMYFNPLLDYLLEGNVTHQLHHCLNKGYYLFVPWKHLISREGRRRDCVKYNKVLKCDFDFGFKG